jgi:hypothetical protein
VARPLRTNLVMDTHKKSEQEQEQRTGENSARTPVGVPVDAPDNDGPAISPQAVSRMPRAEDDEFVRKHSRDFSDDPPRTPGDNRERGD